MIEFIVTATISALIFGLMGTGLNIQWGYGGMVNLGLVGFFAVGAYGTGLAALPPASGEGLEALRDSYLFGLDLPFFVAMWFGVLFAALCGAAIAWIVLRAELSENYLGIMTLAFGQMVFLVFSSEKWIVNSFNGLRNIPPPVDIADPDNFDRFYLALGVIAAVFVGTLVRQLWRSPFGRVMRIVREDPVVAEALGYNSVGYQIWTFTIGAGVAGLGGALWAGFLSSITPNAFTIQETLIVLTAVVVGGTGNMIGTYVGAGLVLGVINQGSRFLPWPDFVDGYVAPIRLILVGLLLILVLRFRPQGVVPEPLVKVRHQVGRRGRRGMTDAGA